MHPERAHDLVPFAKSLWDIWSTWWLHFSNSWTSATLSEEQEATPSFWPLISMVLEENHILFFSSLQQGYRHVSHPHTVSDSDERDDRDQTKLLFWPIQNETCWRTIILTDLNFLVPWLSSHEWHTYKEESLGQVQGMAMPNPNAWCLHFLTDLGLKNPGLQMWRKLT